MCDNCQCSKDPTFLIYDVIITGAFYYCNGHQLIDSCPLSGIVFPNILRRDEILGHPTQTPSLLFQNKSENSLDSRVEMLSESQTIEELPAIPNENKCEQPLEPHKSFGTNPTISTQSTKEGEELFNIHLENFLCQ